MKTAELIGFDDFDEFTVEKVKESIEPLIRKYKKIFGAETILGFKIITEPIRKRREQILYEVTGNLNTTHGLFYVKKSGWEIIDVVDDLIDDLTRQVVDKKEEIKEKEPVRNV